LGSGIQENARSVGVLQFRVVHTSTVKVHRMYTEHLRKQCMIERKEIQHIFYCKIDRATTSVSAGALCCLGTVRKPLLGTLIGIVL
jgi:hypothetical protein